MRFFSLLFCSVVTMIGILLLIITVAFFSVLSVGLASGGPGFLVIPLTKVFLIASMVYAALVAAPFTTDGDDIQGPILTIFIGAILLWWLLPASYQDEILYYSTAIAVIAIPHYLIMRKFIKKYAVSREHENLGASDAVTKVEDKGHA